MVRHPPFLLKEVHKPTIRQKIFLIIDGTVEVKKFYFENVEMLLVYSVIYVMQQSCDLGLDFKFENAKLLKSIFSAFHQGRMD